MRLQSVGANPVLTRDDARAAQMHRAMKGGVWGLGTKKRDLFDALQAGQPHELPAAYESHYARSLEYDLKRELSGKHEERALALLKGSVDAADAIGLRLALRFRPDSGAVFSILGQADKEGRGAAVAAAYEARFGEPLTKALERLGPSGRAGAIALLEGRRVDTIALKLRGILAAARPSADQPEPLRAHLDQVKLSSHQLSTLWQLLASPDVEAAYQRISQTSLRDELGQKLTPQLARTAIAILDRRPTEAAAGQLAAAFNRPGANRFLPWQSLAGLSDTERAALPAAFAEHTGTQLSAKLSVLSKARRLGLEQLLSTGRLSPALELAMAIEDRDERAAVGLLEQLSKPEAYGLASAYETQLQTPVSHAVKKAFSGAAEKRVLLALEGRPDDVAEAAQRARAQRDFERRGAANFIGRVLLDHVLRCQHGKRADALLQKLERSVHEAQAQHVLEPAEAAEIAKLIELMKLDLREYDHAKENVAKTAAVGAGVIAGGAAAIATAGLAAPLATAATSAASSTGVIASKRAVLGNTYGVDRLAQDAKRGALRAGAFAAAGTAIPVLLAPLRDIAGNYALDVMGTPPELRSAEAIQTGAAWVFSGGEVNRTVTLMLERSLAAAAGYGATAGAMTATSSQTWQLGLKSGAKLVMSDAMRAAGIGAVFGGATGALAGLAGGAPSLGSVPDNLVRHYEVNIRGEMRTIEVIGPTSDEYARALVGDVALAADLSNGVIDHGLRQIFVLPLGYEAGAFTSGFGDSFAITNALEPGYRTYSVVHELSHNADAQHGTWGGLLGFGSGERGSPFGHGPFATWYAHTNHYEDLAETNTVLLQRVSNAFPLSWEAGPLDPKKVEWLLENFYGGKMPEP